MAAGIALLRQAIIDTGVVLNDIAPANAALFPDQIMASYGSGGGLGDHNALFRANADVCRILGWVAFPNHVDVAARTRLAERALDLNFKSTFGAISKGPTIGGPGAPGDLFFIETSFFWQYVQPAPSLFAGELRKRLDGFRRLLESVIALRDDAENASLS